MLMAERILAAASRTFGRLGYAAVRVEDILLEAAVSRPTFYKVYRTKEAVFQALSERHHGSIRDRVREVVAAGGEPEAILMRVITVFLTWRASLGPIGRVLDVEARTPGSAIASDRKKTLQDMSGLMNQWLAARGQPDLDPVFILALIAALESVADSLLSGKRVDSETLERAKRIAFQLLGGALEQLDVGASPAQLAR
jgi:AcrR family transcriptional regulator